MPGDGKEPRQGPWTSGEESIGTTPELAIALADAEQLLDYGASNGLLPEAGSTSVRCLIHDLVRSSKIARAEAPTLQMVTDFWVAYARLAHLVQPVTAASLAASKKVSLAGMRIQAVVIVAVVILCSIYLFMGTTTLSETQELINQQNTAALNLWSDLQTLRSTEVNAATHAEADRATALNNERVFKAIVEFSRRSAELLQSADRLNHWFTPISSTIELLKDPADPARTAARQATTADLNVQPDLLTSAEAIENEAVLQIKLYQIIRNYALPPVKAGALIYYSLSTYVLPTIYALLGAYLYSFRLYSELIDRRVYAPSAAHSSRYFIAAIGGLVVGLFGSLLPKSVALPPLAIAFLVGYAVDAFFARLDALISKLKGGEAPATPQAAAHSIARAE